MAARRVLLALGMYSSEDIVEFLMLVGHRARVAFDDACEPGEYVPHEILFLRALYRAGNGMRGRDLARRLGWTSGRVSQVGAALVAKGHVVHAKGFSLTAKGLGEASDASFALAAVAEQLFVGFGEEEREVLRRIVRNSEGLWRATPAGS